MYCRQYLSTTHRTKISQELWRSKKKKSKRTLILFIVITIYCGLNDWHWMLWTINRCHCIGPRTNKTFHFKNCPSSPRLVFRLSPPHHRRIYPNICLMCHSRNYPHSPFPPQRGLTIPRKRGEAKNISSNVWRWIGISTGEGAITQIFCTNVEKFSGNNNPNKRSFILFEAS